MDLMPHVKALLDDLIGITKSITVKRSDIAIANEGSTSDIGLYNLYKQVVDGDLSLTPYTRGQIPYNVLSSIYEWSEWKYSNEFSLARVDDNREDDTYPDTYRYKDSNGRLITIRVRDEDNENGPEERYLTNIGDIYIRQNSTGSFKKLFSNTNSYTNTQISLYKKYNGDTSGLTEYQSALPDSLDQAESVPKIYINSDGKIVNDIVSSYVSSDTDGNMIFYDANDNEIRLFVKDIKFNTYKEVRYRRIEEYILRDDVIDSLGDTVLDANYNSNEVDLLESNSYESNDDGTEVPRGSIGISADELEYIYYGGYANKDYQESVEYIYDTSNQSFVEYVYDNDFGCYRLKRDDDVNLDIYYKRYYNEFYFINTYVKTYEYVKKDLEVPYYYTRADEYDYYELQMPKTNSDGEYEKVDGLIQLAGSGIYVTEENATGPIDKSVAYTKYINGKPGLVDFSETYNTIDGEVLRYSQTAYTAENDNPDKIAIVCTFRQVSKYPHYEYFVEDTAGTYVHNVDDDKYYIDYDSGSSKYSKMVVYNPIMYKDDTGHYTMIDSYVDNNTYIYYNTNISIFEAVRSFSDRDIVDIKNNNYDLSMSYENIIIKKYSEYIKRQYAPYYDDPRWSVIRYDGETNSYYRALNGLPPYNTTMEHPKVDRYKISENYDGDDPNPYVFDLSDDEIDIIEKNGMLDSIKKLHPAKEYLWHLGRHRIDVVEAREAAPFDILEYGEFSNTEHFKMFNDAYKISKNYIIHNHYQPEMFDVNQHYGSYVAMTILVNALNICMAKSGDILIHNKYSDYDTVQLKLKSFGFENTFEHIPLIYRKNIAKNLELLIRNKGIDDIYDIVYKVFGIDDVEVFKYYFRKIWKQDENGEGYYELSMSQVPISSENIVNDIINPDNKLDYDTITNSDKYWGVYETKESVKKMFEDYPFNYMNSKYITLNNRFNISQLNFSSSYYLNYLQDTLDKLGSNMPMLNIDGFDDPISLKNLIIMLFAIHCVRFGFAGNIPSDIVASAAVLKFNLNEEVTITGDDAKTKSKLIEIIEKYYYKMSNREIISDTDKEGWSDSVKYNFENYDRLQTVKATEKYWRGKGKAKNIKNNILEIDKGTSANPKPPIVLPGNITSPTKAIDIISEAYLKNLETDTSLTSDVDEGSLYNTILRYREDAKTYNDYCCFNDLLKAISTAKILNATYNIGNYVWEQVAEVKANIDSDGKVTYTKNDPSCWKYSDIGLIWSVIQPDENGYIKDNNFVTFMNKVQSGELDGLYICTDVPLISKMNGNEYAMNIGEMSHSELISFIENYNADSTSFDGIVVYEKKDIFPEITGIKDPSGFIDKFTKMTGKADFIVSNNYDVIYGTEPPDTKEFDDSVNFGTYYVQGIETKMGECIVNVYQYTNIAFTYEMYLKYKQNDLYQYMQKREGEETSDYIARLNELYSIIIATIENSITGNTLREKLNLSIVDFSNIAKYIKIVLEVFKSYTIDLASMDSIYLIDDPSQYRIKPIDGISIEENSYMSSNMRSHSMISFEEGFSSIDRLGFHDEIMIETLNLIEEGS